jgi:di/tricarboxylate transporter
VVTFGRWICVSLPFGVLNTLLAWAYLIVVVQPDDIQSIPLIVYERGTVLGKRNVTVIVSSLLTILMFANFTYLEFFFGEIGIVAAVYVVFMFGSGILSEVSNSLFASLGGPAPGLIDWLTHCTWRVVVRCRWTLTACRGTRSSWWAAATCWAKPSPLRAC